jgi:tRNA 2-thiouridine synthesizing protein B
MKTTLFVASRSPWKAREVETIAKLASPGDAVIFIQEGVYHAGAIPEEVNADMQSLRDNDVSVYFLEPDLMARGLQKRENSVDYEGFLDLVEKCQNVFH